MSLLREIQDAAVDSKGDLASLLRRCKILAARLGNEEFKSWVEQELSGYETVETLPDYRVFSVHSKGHFSGAFGSGLKNAPIPMSCIPEEFREALEHSYLTAPVSTLQALISKSKNGVLEEPWNPDLVALVGQKIYRHMNCMQAWKVVPEANIVGALDAVRTRILNFALEIEAANPQAGEAPLNSNPIPQSTVQHIFNTYVSGNIQNMAAGNAGEVAQRAKSSEKASIEILQHLIEAIKDSSADAAVKELLVQQVYEMRSAADTEGFKEHYRKFIGTLADHMQVLGSAVSPYLPALTAMLP